MRFSGNLTLPTQLAAWHHHWPFVAQIRPSGCHCPLCSLQEPSGGWTQGCFTTALALNLSDSTQKFFQKKRMPIPSCPGKTPAFLQRCWPPWAEAPGSLLHVPQHCQSAKATPATHGKFRGFPRWKMGHSAEKLWGKDGENHRKLWDHPTTGGLLSSPIEARSPGLDRLGIHSDLSPTDLSAPLPLVDDIWVVAKLKATKMDGYDGKSHTNFWMILGNNNIMPMMSSFTQEFVVSVPKM